MGNSVSLHRVFKSTPEKVYRAFLDPAALAKWISPRGFTATVHHLDAQVGGTFKMSFTNFGTGSSQSFGGTYLELVPHSKLRYTDQFDDPNMPEILQVAVDLKPVLCGTEVSIEQSNIPASIPLEFCYLGWQESLDQLAALVEPEIPDGA
ncbi:MAG: SRPBCC family protein [Fibrobacteria bacterium]|nr:SRPBCC family protein [Fibrobacteria bacterium]